MKKKILAMLLAAVMVMALLPTAFAAVPASSNEAQTSIALERSEKDGVDYFVSKSLPLYEFFWGSYYEREPLIGYSVLSHETELTLTNNADAGDEGYLRIAIDTISIDEYGRYIMEESFRLYLTKDGRFIPESSDEFQEAVYNKELADLMVELRPGESVTFSLSGCEIMRDYLGSAYDEFGNEYGKYDLLVLSPYFINASYSEYDDNLEYAIRIWGEVNYAFVIDDEEAARLRQESAQPEPTDPETPTVTFPDVNEGDWFYDDVQWAAQNGWINGYPNGTFAPHDYCTEEDILYLLWKAAGSPDSDAGLPDSIANRWSAAALRWALENDMINGTFQYNTFGTRATTVYYLWLAYSAQSAGEKASFSDVSEDSPYIDALSWSVEAGIVGGYPDGTFAPNNELERAHLARLLHLTVDLVTGV